MYCTKCGKELPEGGAFCTFCGHPQNGKLDETKSVRPVQSAPGELRILPEGKLGGLIKTGFFIYLDGVKYKSTDHKNGITTKVTPGVHTIVVADTTISNEKINSAGEAASNAGSYFGGWGSIIGTAVEIGTKASTAIKGDKGTARMDVSVASGEHVTIRIVAKNGVFASFTIEEIERT